MFKFVTKVVVLTVCGTLIISSVGCEPEGTVNSKSERLFAAENLELRKEITELKENCERKLTNQKKLLEKCKQDKQVLELQAGDELTKTLDDDFTKMLLEQIETLQQENNRLKAEVNGLKKQADSQ